MALLLRKKGEQATEGWRSKLRPTACQLEQLLYHTATSAKEYMNEDLLTERLKDVVQIMGMKKARTRLQGPRTVMPHDVLYASPPAAGANQEPTSPDSHIISKGKRLAKQQNLLYLVLHAKSCTCSAGRCPVTPLCAKMKTVWAHACKCEQPANTCPESHCGSSRWVLDHFKRCKSHETCELCQPVLLASRTCKKIRQKLSSSFVFQTLRKCHYDIKGVQQDAHNTGAVTASPRKRQCPSHGIAPSASDSMPSKRMKSPLMVSAR